MRCTSPSHNVGGTQVYFPDGHDREKHRYSSAYSAELSTTEKRAAPRPRSAQAVEARALAECLTDPEAKRLMLGVTEVCEKFAVWEEDQKESRAPIPLGPVGRAM